MQRMPVLALTAAILLAGATMARAQDAPPQGVAADKVLGERSDLAAGWSYKLKISASGSFNHTSHVVGALDGATVQFGALIDGNVSYLAGSHRWENTLVLNEGQTLTPQFDSFIKSTDQLKIESTYTFVLPWVPWLGPFARLGMDAAILRGYEVRADEITVVRNRNDGTVGSKVKRAGSRIALTDPFEPLLIEQSAGFFANPISVGRLTFVARAGLGFREIVSQGGFTRADDGATPELELQQLADSVEGGALAEVEAYGGFREIVTWRIKGKMLFPFFTNADTELDSAELISTELSLKLSVALAKWFSVDYILLLKRIPLVLDEWQIQNGIFATTAFELP